MTNENSNLITKQGFDKLKAELDNLKLVERPNIAKATEHARSLGDLSENAEYSTAKEKQHFVESRISFLEKTHGELRIVDTKDIKNKDTVNFGATVTLKNLDTNEEMVIIFVGELEVNIDKNMLSLNSPIGKELVGKTTNNNAIIKAHSGEKRYQIISIKY